MYRRWTVLYWDLWKFDYFFTTSDIATVANSVKVRESNLLINREFSLILGACQTNMIAGVNRTVNFVNDCCSCLYSYDFLFSIPKPDMRKKTPRVVHCPGRWNIKAFTFRFSMIYLDILCVKIFAHNFCIFIRNELLFRRSRKSIRILYSISQFTLLDVIVVE